VAIVQISRIQIRRGQKLTGSGVPQLAGGELGWAVDTRELYIGNGSVSEGSPAVGNSKILTEHDNLFAFGDQYQYLKGDATMLTGTTATTPVTRTLQDRLDERVNVKSFGVKGDATDVTVKLQQAIDQLWINNSTKGDVLSRVVLSIDAGEYTISSSIKIPPHATIIGAGSDKVIITQTGNAPIFETVNSASTPGSPAQDATSTTLNQARHIHLKGMTLKHTSTNVGLKLQSCRESIFEDLIIEGGWTSGATLLVDQIGIRMACLSTAVNTIRNTFRNVQIKGFTRGIESKYDIENNLWDKCIFETLGYGIVFGDGTVINNAGMLTGPIHNVIQNSKFQDIDRNAIWIDTGNYNTSDNNVYVDVGNNGGTEANAAHPVINFTYGTALSNVSAGDFFSRTRWLSFDQSLITGFAYIPEVQGPAIYDMEFSYRFNVVQYTSFVRVLRAPGESDRAVYIDYVYRSGSIDAVRTGTLEILINRSLSTATLTDSHSYVGAALYEPNISFQATATDENGDTEVDTVVVEMLNLTSADTGTILFKVKYKS
ncbi:uncharacterized protein METZ01_LOCUS111841, partial [marine metagenome]